MPAVGDQYVNVTLNERGKIVGGGPVKKDDRTVLGYWRFQWFQLFVTEVDGEVTKEVRPGSTTQVRCAGMAEDAGGWAPFEDEKMWRKV